MTWLSPSPTKSFSSFLSPCSVPPSPCSVPHHFVNGSNGSYPAGTSYTKRFHMVWRDSATKSLKVHWTMTKSLHRSTKSLLRSNARDYSFINGSNGSYPAGTSYTKRFHMVWRDSATKSLRDYWTMTKSLLRSTKSLLCSTAPTLH